MLRSVEIVLALGLLALLSGCIHPPVPHGGGGHRGPAPVVTHRPGPPPHAPAHGYRHRHGHGHGRGGVELVFDSGLGVYAVVGFDNHYFHDGHFYRQAAFGWELSTRIDGGWVVAQYSVVPPRLAERAYRRHQKHKHKRWKRRHHRRHHY